MFAILTRLAPSSKVDLMTKLKIYNGEEIVEKGMTRKIDIMELKEEAPREGMTGISTRFIMKALDMALSESEFDCINPISVMEMLIKSVKELSVSEEEKNKYIRFIQDSIKKEYNKILEKEVTKAFIYGYREQAESLFNNYLDHAEAFVNKARIKDHNTGEELEPDEEVHALDRGADRNHRSISKGFQGRCNGIYVFCDEKWRETGLLQL